MVTVAEMRRRWDKVNLVEYTANAMVEKERDLVRLNKEQLHEGKNALNQMITPDYAPATVNVKMAEGKEWRFVTLRDTGSFQDKMQLNIVGTSFVVDSTDSKTSELKSKYGDDVLGLTQESKEIAWTEHLKPEVVEDMRKETGAI